MKEWITDMVKEELGKYDSGYSKKWDNQRKKNAEVLGYKLSGKSDIKESKKKDSRGTVRDYKKEYAKYGSSKKAKKYRAELNKYNRKKGTYGNGDGKDASHKGGKIVGFESQSKNRGRAEKSRLKKEDINEANKMEKTMQKLAKSLGIKSVVSMHTGKGSLSYFLDDDREAKKLQKFLQRSFKRVRLITLDKSKGDTANWVVAADMLGFESVNEAVKNLSVHFPKRTMKQMKDVEKFVKKRIPKAKFKQKGNILHIDGGGKSMKRLSQLIYNEFYVDKVMWESVNEAIKKVSDAEDGSGYRQVWIGVYTGKMISFKANFPADAKKHTIDYFKVSKPNWGDVIVISKKEYDSQQGWHKQYKESVNERVKDPKLKKGQKIRFKNDSRRVYTLKKINVGVRGISDKDDPSGTSYMFVAPGNRKEYFTKKTWNDAVKKGWLQLESINERFRPSDRKVLMVVVRDIINKLRKRNPDIDRPDRQLGQALNAILRAMTREKSDRNYRQYKKYFPKYNDKLLRRLASAYFDESYNVQNTFMRNAMKYSFKESVNEKKGVPGSVFTIDTAKETSELMTKALKKVAPDIRRGQIYHSALGGADRVSIVGKFSLDPKKTWANNILENSRFITFHLDNDGTLEVNVNGYPFAMRRKVQMRKSRNNDIKQVLKRMITHFSMLNKKYPEGM